MPIQRSRALPLTLGTLGVASVARGAYVFTVRRMLRRSADHLMRGNPEPLLNTFSANAVLILEGRHSWSGHHLGRTQIRRFLERFVAQGITGEIHEVLVQGPPWRTLVAARMTDRAADRDGRVIYRNHAILLARVRWGRIVSQQVFEDTQSVAAYDAILGVGPAPAS